MGYVILVNQLLWVFLFIAMKGREWILEMTCNQNNSTSGAGAFVGGETLELGVLLMVDMLHLQGFPRRAREEVHHQSLD